MDSEQYKSRKIKIIEEESKYHLKRIGGLPKNGEVYGKVNWEINKKTKT